MTRIPRELLAEHKRATTAPALELLEQLYERLLGMKEFVTKGGLKGEVEPFESPTIDENGELHCGFDIRLADGSHLEFMVQQTGWGKSLVPTGRADKPPSTWADGEKKPPANEQRSTGPGR